MSRIATRSRTSILIALFSFLAVSLSSAQVATGTPAFGSFGGGPFDVVNLGNLNTHFSVPILHKAGRGLPFTYDLSYDSSIWTAVGVSGSQSWQPAPGFGWSSTWTGNSGYVLYTAFIQSLCYDSGGHQDGEVQVWNNYVYHDAFGRTHPFSGQITIYSQNCTGTSTTSFTSTATDGSGLTISVTNGTTLYLTTPSGAVLVPPAVQIPPTSAQPATKTDANGNFVNANSGGQFFDTLSSTVPVLTISGTGDQTSPIKFTYPAPADGAASCSPITNCVSYTMNYTLYTVATDFRYTTSPKIAEYPPTKAALVSSIALPDGTSYTFGYEATTGTCTPLSGTTACVTGRINSVTLPTGGSITYTFRGCGSCGHNYINADDTTGALTRVISATTTAPSQTWLYDRSPLGTNLFSTTVTDPNSNQTIINFAEDSNTSVPTYNFYETQRQVKQLISGTQTLLATSIKCYNAHYASCATANVTSPISQTDTYSELPNGSTRLSEVVYNTTGLVTDDKEYTYGVTMGSAPGNTDLIRETAIAYASLGNGIVNRPSSVNVYDWTSGTRTQLASTTYAYSPTVTGTSGTPQHSSVSGDRGNVTTLTTSTSATTSLSKSFTYYDTGNPYVATDVNGAQTTYAYSSAANPYNSSLTASCGNSFATGITEPIAGLSRSMQWNCIGGVSPQATDENGKIVKSDFTDPYFWRPADVYDQENNETTIGYDGQRAVETALQNFNGGSSASDSRTQWDGFGRTNFSQRLQAPGSTNYDTAEFDYNNLGQTSRSTMLYSAAKNVTSKNTTIPATSTTYDALGRVLTVTDADGGTVTYTYTNNDVLQVVGGTPTGTQSFQKQFEYDGLGRLTSVCEISSTLPGEGTCGQVQTKSGYWTKYTYDALGRLLTVKQNAQAVAASQQTRTYAYDWLGRLTQETNPESGTTSYAYDAATVCPNPSAGNLVTRTDGNGNYQCYYYDALKRLTDVGNNNQNGTNSCKRFRYDNSAGYAGSTKPTGLVNTLGRLVEAATDVCNGSNDSLLTDEWFSYSPRGEVTDVYESTPHSGGYYHTTASYWPIGTLDVLSGIPGVPTIYYGASTGTGLDGEGRVTQVTAASGTTPLVKSVTYYSGTTTNPLGSLTGVTFGSSVSGNDSDSFTYDFNTGRMTGYTFAVNGINDVGTLTWSANGTLTKLAISDAIPGTSDTQTCNYLYDDLRRVSSSNCGVLWTQNFTYDPFGNITKTVPTGDNGLNFLPTYSTTPPTNQFTALPGKTPVYDGDGNLLTDNLNTYTWNVYGNLSTASSGSTTVTSTYDGLGRMVESASGSTYTEFLYGPTGTKLGTLNGSALLKAFVALPSGAKAIYTSAGLKYFRHSDWLGSSRLTSNVSRTMYSSSSYAPFGEQYSNAGTADASFTGQDQDTLSSLYDFPARRQSPSQGRWISPDPLGIGAVKLSKPQSWNRYAYVNNNPLALIDPMGMEDSECDPGDDCSGDGSDGSDGGGGDGGGDGGGGTNPSDPPNSGCTPGDFSCDPFQSIDNPCANPYSGSCNSASGAFQSILAGNGVSLALDPCVYLNNAGTSVDSVDHNSSPGECSSTGGQWLPPQPAGTLYYVDQNGNAQVDQLNQNALSIFTMVGNNFPADPVVQFGPKTCFALNWGGGALGAIGLTFTAPVVGLAGVALWGVGTVGNC
jgi:RHS repeat-associated protein